MGPARLTMMVRWAAALCGQVLHMSLSSLFDRSSYGRYNYSHKWRVVLNGALRITKIVSTNIPGSRPRANNRCM